MKKDKKKKDKYLYIIAAISLIIFVFVILVGYCGSSLNKLVNSVVESDSANFDKYYKRGRMCGKRLPIYEQLPKLLGDNTYLILLQNNTEIRPSGGFMGSYAKVQFKDNVLLDWEIFDIYTPDGQMEGHVDPVTPFQQAFWTGDFRLRNANWDVDYSDAAEDIDWFFKKGGEEEHDGIVAINLGLVKEMLKIIGPVKPLDFPERIDAETFYETTQKYAEEGFFPGSRQKKTYLGAVSTALWEDLFTTSIYNKALLARLIIKQLENGQILVWVSDDNMQKEVVKAGWSGSLGSYNNDFVYVVEANLGANKANCCIEREIVHDVNINGIADNKLIISWRNNNESNVSKPPLSWGGDYINFQRVVLPEKAIIKKVVVGGEEYQQEDFYDLLNPPEIKDDKGYRLDQKDNFTVLGFWAVVPSRDVISAEIYYELPLSNDKVYEVVVKNQPGIYSLPYKLLINNEKIIDKIISKEEKFEVQIR